MQPARQTSGPPLLKLSLKVWRGIVLIAKSAFVVARSCGLKARDRFRDPQGSPATLLESRTAIESVEHQDGMMLT